MTLQLMDINLTQDKAGRLDYSEISCDSCHVLTGVDLDADGKPVKWKVENSWGTKDWTKGYFIKLLMPGWMNTLIKSLSAKELPYSERIGSL